MRGRGIAGFADRALLTWDDDECPLHLQLGSVAVTDAPHVVPSLSK